MRGLVHHGGVRALGQTAGSLGQTRARLSLLELGLGLSCGCGLHPPPVSCGVPGPAPSAGRKEQTTLPCPVLGTAGQCAGGWSSHGLKGCGRFPGRFESSSCRGLHRLRRAVFPAAGTPRGESPQKYKVLTPSSGLRGTCACGPWSWACGWA